MARSFFAAGDGEKLVYCASAGVAEAAARLGCVATVVDGGQPVDLRRMSEDLLGRGVRAADGRGRRSLHTQFLDRRPRRRAAPGRRTVLRRRLGGPPVRRRRASSRGTRDRRATLAEVRQIGDVVLLRYALSPRFRAEPLEEV